VVGIVANRLVDRYHKPALLLTESEDGILRGSARSVEGLHITEAIAAQKDLLLGFGGHPMAAGLSMQKENLSAFRKGPAGYREATNRHPQEPAPDRCLAGIDELINWQALNCSLLGAGNPE
jgi:single-stranded-DNA-specific exonuclease